MSTVKMTVDSVEKIAKLANLTLNSSEKKQLANQLSQTLDTVAVLDSLDTKNVTASAQVTGLNNVVRKDEAEPSLSLDAALSGTKLKENGYFKVKKSF